MTQYEIENASINIRWMFADMLPNLPVPGSEAFTRMIRALRPLGIVPNNISIEAATPNLGDVALQILLLNRIITLRISYSGIEIAAFNPEPEQVLHVLQVVDAAFTSLKLIDEAVVQGKGGTNIGLHLRLIGDDVNDYLRQRVSTHLDPTKLTPDAIAFKLTLDEVTQLANTRLVIAKSATVENGLYLEISYEGGSGTVGDPVLFLEKLKNHYHNILDVLELEPRPSEEAQ